MAVFFLYRLVQAGLKGLSANQQNQLSIFIVKNPQGIHTKNNESTALVTPKSCNNLLNGRCLNLLFMDMYYIYIHIDRPFVDHFLGPRFD